MLIVDTYSFGTLQVINEGTNGGKMVLKGLFAEAEIFNRNNRKYSLSTLTREVNRLQPMIKERTLLGELDHPSTPTVSLTNASHLITELYMEGNKVMGSMELLSTPTGKIAQDLIRDNVRTGVSSRATGSLSPISEGRFQVGDDLKIICWDIVADPSCIGANPIISEGAEIMSIMESYEESLNNYRDEQVYIQAFKDALSKNKRA